MDLRYVTPKVFKALWGPGRYFGAYGGRGSGKSHNFAGKAVVRCSERPGTRGICIREVQKTLKESSKLLIEDKIRELHCEHEFRMLSSEIRTPGGGIIVFQGMQDHNAESVKSFENFDWAWIEEGQVLSKRSLELLRPTIRKAGSEIWASWNPRNQSDPVDGLFRGMIPPPGMVSVSANWRDNQFFTPELEAERQHDKIANEDRYGHIWEGDYEPQAIGAIWKRQYFHDNRLADVPPDMGRIVIGVDPAATDTDTSNEHGITVCGIGADQRGYVLEDASMRGSPHQWATRVVAMFDLWEADAIVIEVNMGGDMVKHTLQTIRRGLPIIEERAAKGKHVRAEPIAALYATNRVSHVGTFSELEDQFCLFTAHGWEGDDDKSPDRAESAIWAFTNLFPKLTRGRGREKSEPPARPRQEAWMG
tara:strand:- start:21939 stop:23198 length:1260 start_codon:yes stop_codon:yes gene_type:complete